jgi:NTE family protein
MKTLPKLPDLFERPFGLVLSGGGARGMFHVGVWSVLAERGARVDVISGTSAGAINGALIAAGRTPRQMQDFWLSLAKDPPVVVNEPFFAALVDGVLRLLRDQIGGITTWSAKNLGAFGGSTQLLARAMEHLLTRRFDVISRFLDEVEPNYLFNTDELRQRLRQEIGGEIPMAPDSEEGCIRLAINAMDIRSGKVVRFVNHKPQWRSKSSNYIETAISVNEIVSSASIPLLFNTVTDAAVVAPLWDGGLLVNTPIAPAVTLGARRVVPVLVSTGDDDGSSQEPLTLGTSIERVADAFLENAYNTDRKLLLVRNQLAARKARAGGHADREHPVVLLEPIRPEHDAVFNAGSYLYFGENQLQKIYDAGRTAAERWIDDGPLVDELKH